MTGVSCHSGCSERSGLSPILLNINIIKPTQWFFLGVPPQGIHHTINIFIQQFIKCIIINYNYLQVVQKVQIIIYNSLFLSTLCVVFILCRSSLLEEPKSKKKEKRERNVD